MNVKIFYDNRQDTFEVSQEIMNLVEQISKQVLLNERFEYDVVFDVSFVDNTLIKEINKEYRQTDKETDVLSFPIIKCNNGAMLKEDCLDFDYDNNAYILGDIVISLEKVFTQSNVFGHSFERELGYLTAHSMLHLLGYDHMTSQSEQEMKNKTERVMNQLNLTRE